MTNPIGRVFIGTTTVAGIANPVYTEYEYTHADVTDAYITHIGVINDIFLKTSSSSITQADADAVSAALASLLSLAQNGLNRNSVANLNVAPIMKNYFMTKPMAENLDLLIRSFQAVGAADPSDAITQNQLAKWKDLSIVSPVIQDVLRSATNAVAANRSTQSLVELEYVATGNDLIAEKLASLEDALTITKQVLDSLSTLQDIRNRLVVKDKAPLNKIFITGAGGLGGADQFQGDKLTGIHAADYLGYYRAGGGCVGPGASVYFGAPLFPTVSSTLINGATLTSLGSAAFSNLKAIQQSILNFIPRLSAIADSAVLADSNSLYNRLKKVRDDFSSMLTTTAGAAVTNASTSADKIAALKRFLLDGQDPSQLVSGKLAGDAQQDLTVAITAGQGLNDQQKQQVRNYLFVFEEFYKSASAILQRLSQIIEKMAQNISR